MRCWVWGVEICGSRRGVSILVHQSNGICHASPPILPRLEGCPGSFPADSQSRLGPSGPPQTLGWACPSWSNALQPVLKCVGTGWRGGPRWGAGTEGRWGSPGEEPGQDKRILGEFDPHFKVIQMNSCGFLVCCANLVPRSERVLYAGDSCRQL